MDYDNFELYMISLYWAIMTLTSVGYGDVIPVNTDEKILCCIVMIGGIFMYSYIVGSFTNLITNLDSRKVQLKS